MERQESGTISRPSYPMGFTFTSTKVTQHSDALPEPQGYYARRGNTLELDFPATATYPAMHQSFTVVSLTDSRLTLQATHRNADGSRVESVNTYERQ